MPNFGCACGAVIGEGNEPPGANCVAYTLGVLNAAEARIGLHAAAFWNEGRGTGRAAWLASYFGPDYPRHSADREVIEDIASRQLNEGFIPMFRCHNCGRIALKGANGWTFYCPELGSPQL